MSFYNDEKTGKNIAKKQYTMDKIKYSLYELKNIKNDIFIITDDNVKSHCLPAVSANLSLNKTVQFDFKAGDDNKNFETLTCILKMMNREKLTRNTTVIGLGGGTVLDLAGFVSNIYLRGVKELIFIPTTLLSMVDAAFGGKNGINLKEGKNLVGSFREPDRIFIYTDFLKSLPVKELICGMAEVLKYGLIKDRNLLEYKMATQKDEEGFLEDRIGNRYRIKRQEKQYEANLKEFSEDRIGNRYRIDIEKSEGYINKMIEQSIRVKKDFVKEDFMDKGVRKILNFGHTFAHGIEKIYNYKDISHGEAVAFGMILACMVGEKLGITRKNLSGEVEEIMKQQGFETRIAFNPGELAEHIKFDKKSFGSGVELILLEDVGRPIVFNIEYEDLEKLLWEVHGEIF